MIAESQALEEMIAQRYSEGYMRFGDLSLDVNTYAARIRAIAQDNLGDTALPEAMTNFIQTLNCTDLYLATACAKESLGFQGGSALPGSYSSVAWQKFEDEYKGFVRDLGRYFFRQTVEAQDFADSLIADLFLPSRSGISRIMTYDGRSSLCTWLRVVFSHRAINSQRCVSFRQATEIEPDLPDRPALINFHRMVRARLYGGLLAESMSQACGKLLPRERMLLLWRYKDGMRLGEIAEMMGIHQSNVSRRLDRLYRKLREAVMANLRRHGMSASAAEDCVQDLRDNPYHDISLLDCLAASRTVPCEARPARNTQRKDAPVRFGPLPLHPERHGLFVVNGGRR